MGDVVGVPVTGAAVVIDMTGEVVGELVTTGDAVGELVTTGAATGDAVVGGGATTGCVGAFIVK